MRVQSSTSETAARAKAGEPDPREFPVREYIGAMATELAQMARWDGDEALGQMLDSAAALACIPRETQVSKIAEAVPPVRNQV